MEKLSYLDNRIEEHFGGLKSDISILRHELKEEIEGVKSTLTEIEKSLESAWNVIADLQAESKSHADFKKTYQSSLDNVKSELAMASSKNAKLETEIDALKVRFLEEQEKVIALENYFRRENLRFMNVPEQEGENCANFIYDIIENELNIDVENLQFHAIHRVGKRRSSNETSKAYPRPIIARFLCREDRDSVLKAKGRLRNSSQYKNVYITQDYAKAIQMERKVLIKAMFLARKKGMKAKVVDRNLVVNNNVYNVDNIPDNLEESSPLNSNSS
ncbi:hypothetical protein P5673_012128 [Acropora cervicornis]|uniref:L1 transposable element RRM domain-containing protein n=1 Tax=Acropora cervicornis TaxID=6130 RepID=A0AAD9V7Z4_ACRCE|nr:hypothetical protein P5673_012128 [Acropora cervicornis]